MIVKIKNKEYIVHSINYNFHHEQIHVGIYHHSYDSAVLEKIEDVEIIDNRIPPDWVCILSEDKRVSQLYPKEFTNPIDTVKLMLEENPNLKLSPFWEKAFAEESTDFWERYHDACPIAEEIFANVTKKLKAFHDIKE